MVTPVKDLNLSATQDRLTAFSNFQYKKSWCGNKNKDTELVSSHAKTCIEDIQQQQKTLSWSGWKRLIHVHGAFYTGTVIVPLATLTGALYTVYYYPTETGQFLQKISTSFYNIIGGKIVGGFDSILQQNPYGMFFGGTCVASVTTFAATRDYYSTDSYIKAGLKGLGLYSIYLWTETVKKWRDTIDQSYNIADEATREKIANSRRSLVADFKKDYADLAKRLEDIAREAQNDPQKTLLLKKEINNMAERVPSVMLFLQNKCRLTPTEASEVLKPIQEIIALIQKYQLLLKTPTSLEDSGYNLQLLTSTPLKEFDETICIPASALNNIKNIKVNQLGWGHKIKAGVTALISGGVSTISTGAIAGAVSYYSFPAQLSLTKLGEFQAHPTNFQSQTGALVYTAALLALSAGGFAATTVANRANKKAQANQDYNQQQYEEAKNTINNLYNGMMIYLAMEKGDLEKCPEKIAQLRSLACALRERLPKIENIIDGYKIPNYKGTDATQQLRAAIDDIDKTISK